MTIEEASKLLADMYGNAADKEKLVSVHLFGIRYATELRGMPLKEIAARAKIPLTYATEVNKGINLSRFVDLKP